MFGMRHSLLHVRFAVTFHSSKGIKSMAFVLLSAQACKLMPHNTALNIIRFAHLDAPKAARQLIQR